MHVVMLEKITYREKYNIKFMRGSHYN